MTHEQLVIPEPDAFGFRVTNQTPLALIVAVLRQANPRAAFGALKFAAAGLQRGEWPAPAEPDPAVEVDTAARVFVDESTKTREAPQESVPAPADNPPAVAAPERRKPTRAEVEAWVARQPRAARGKLQMSSRGRIPAATLAAYRAAHRDEVLASMVPV